jgi:septation ring formation regulator EzrA
MPKGARKTTTKRAQRRRRSSALPRLGDEVTRVLKIVEAQAETAREHRKRLDEHDERLDSLDEQTKDLRQNFSEAATKLSLLLSSSLDKVNEIAAKVTGAFDRAMLVLGEDKKVNEARFEQLGVDVKP